MSKKDMIVLDTDFSVLWCDVHPLVRELYREIKKRFGPDFMEWLLQLVDLPGGRRIEYFMEGLGSRFLLRNASTLITPGELKKAREHAYIAFFTRRSEREVLPYIDKNGLTPHVDIIIGREQVGYGVMNGEHIRTCIKKMGCTLDSARIGSDSPSHINIGNMLGAETWLFKTGYHPLAERWCNPTRIFNSIQDGIAWYNTEGYLRQHIAL